LLIILAAISGFHLDFSRFGIFTQAWLHRARFKHTEYIEYTDRGAPSALSQLSQKAISRQRQTGELRDEYQIVNKLKLNRICQN
jgi:hypothetical protein